MTFLEIAQRIRQECGIAGTGPTSITSQSGELRQVVDWMAAAYEDIQSAHSDWEFLHGDFSFTCTPAKADYTPAECGVDDLGEWLLDGVRCWLTQGDEQYLPWVNWATMRDTWKIGDHRTRPGRPMCFSVMPNSDSITFDCVPDQTFTISGEYSKRPEAVGGNSDSPIFPARYHMAVVWRAVMMFGLYAAEPDKFTASFDEYSRIMRRMSTEMLPDLEFGPPLA